ncbi:fatty acyl-AMP ligase [Sphingomonas sp. R647]|uniref:fatty acyl-AMP ligase n=1 Tax=Sphingomonas sp. R647 TaxID=2875233 RepID=UPI001CD40EB6|nr:fatty acyl-AMP ligase [Sphingomonas sp. R647]MCA1196448.1 fatty acyl-AMP ligase [Sphingomonas sp. R647]
MTILADLERWAEQKPNAVAVALLDSRGAVSTTLSYSALRLEARRIGALLDRLGMRARRILLPAESSPEFAAALLGTMGAHAVPVPVPTSSRPRAIERLRAIVETAGVAHALRLSGSAALAGALAELDWFDPTTDGRLGRSAPSGEPYRHDPAALALLQYTSGSTAAPKGVRVTHANLVANLAMLRTAMKVDEDSRVLTWLPMHHDMGLVGQLLLAISSGATLLMMTPLSFVRRPETWIQAVGEHSVTVSGAPNFAYDLVTRRADRVVQPCDLSRWRVAFCGAEKVRPETLRAFATRFDANGFDPLSLFPCYGLAEATVYVSGGPAGSGLRVRAQDGAAPEVASCGTPGARVEIVDPSSRQLVADGIEGEIWVKGEHVAEGYESSDDDRDVFAAQIQGDASATYLRTGDLGFQLEGELFVTGRLKDVIVHHGENIHPDDIEVVIRASSGGYGAMGAVFSIQRNGEETVIALFEVERGTSRETMDEMIRAGMIAVADAQGLRLNDLILLAPGAIPRTTSGKVRRAASRARFLAGRLEPLLSYQARRDAARVGSAQVVS